MKEGPVVRAEDGVQAAIALHGQGVAETFRALLTAVYRRQADELGLASEHGLDEAAFLAGALGQA